MEGIVSVVTLGFVSFIAMLIISPNFRWGLYNWLCAKERELEERERREKQRQEPSMDEEDAEDKHYEEAIIQAACVVVDGQAITIAVKGIAKDFPDYDKIDIYRDIHDVATAMKTWGKFF